MRFFDKNTAGKNPDVEIRVSYNYFKKSIEYIPFFTVSSISSLLSFVTAAKLPVISGLSHL